MESDSNKTEIGTTFQGLSACFKELKMKVETVCQGFQFWLLQFDVPLGKPSFKEKGILWERKNHKMVTPPPSSQVYESLFVFLATKVSLFWEEENNLLHF